MRMFAAAMSGAIAAGLLTTSMGVHATAAELARYKNCAALNAKYPAGIAKDQSAAKKAGTRGYIRPVVDKAEYASNTALDKSREGLACPVTTADARWNNAQRFFASLYTLDPAKPPQGTPAAAPNSPALMYLQRYPRALEATNWYDYQSQGLIIPVLGPPTITITGQKSNPASQVSVVDPKDNTITSYNITYDAMGRVQTWSTASGPLEERIFAVNNTVNEAGLSITPTYLYRTNTGTVQLTASVTNTSADPLSLSLTNVDYTGPDGVTTRGFARGTCIQPGQTIPFIAATRSAAVAGLPATWIIAVNTCDYGQAGRITLSLT